MNKEAAEHDILWMAVDDWTGLWEAVWGIQTMWPELRGQPAKDAARQLIEKLLTEESIYLCFFKASTNSERRVPLKQAVKLLDLPESWQPPESDVEHLRFAATEKGEERMLEIEASLEASP